MKRTFRYDAEVGHLVEVFYSSERVAPDVMGDLPAYTSPIDGRLIDGRAQRREDLKRNGCRPYEDGERAQMVRNQAAADQRLERGVNETVDKWYATSSSRKHELLEQAIRAGANPQIERR